MGEIRKFWDLQIKCAHWNGETGRVGVLPFSVACYTIPSGSPYVLHLKLSVLDIFMHETVHVSDNSDRTHL